MSDTMEKEYSLKPIQEQMIQTMQQSYQSQISNFMSFLALEFWGYTVTENTRFRIEEGKVFITEDVVESKPEVSTTSDTGKALKDESTKKGN